MGPIGGRIGAVVPESPTRKTNFSQISRSMSSLSAASILPLRQASRRASERAIGFRHIRRTRVRCIGPACAMTPGSAIVAAM